VTTFGVRGYNCATPLPAELDVERFLHFHCHFDAAKSVNHQEATMRIRAFLLLSAVIGLTACSDTTGPIPASQIAGFWTFERGPGSSVEMSLAVNADLVSGNGSWFNEGMSNGDLTAAGHIAGGSVQLDLVLSASVLQGGGVVRHGIFSGRLVTSNSLVGSLTYDDEPTFAASFNRLARDPVTAHLQAP
jgi:hypothetical protein